MYGFRTPLTKLQDGPMMSTPQTNLSRSSHHLNVIDNSAELGIPILNTPSATGSEHFGSLKNRNSGLFDHSSGVNRLNPTGSVSSTPQSSAIPQVSPRRLETSTYNQQSDVQYNSLTKSLSRYPYQPTPQQQARLPLSPLQGAIQPQPAVPSTNYVNVAEIKRRDVTR